MENSKEILELAVEAGEVLLENGGEIFRVQETMYKIAQAYGAKDFHVFVIATAVFVSINHDGAVYSTQIRHVPISPVHLGRVAALNNLSREISAGKHTAEEALQEIRQIRNIAFASNAMQIFAAGVGSGCFCYLFGGSFLDCAASCISGFILYLFVLFAGRKGLSRIITNIMGSALVTFCGLMMFRMGFGQNMNEIVIGSIVPLLPGVPLTTSIRDFLNGDYLSGTIRLIDAVLVACCIAIGVGALLKIFQMAVGGIL